ncbi:MAG TPA: RcpC/CpaB family pilus assembly protein [Acidimicrobiia bacterium]|nr:RcpC/CpaB family pilus assembly protein [Acidimicrobiia bacterium]
MAIRRSSQMLILGLAIFVIGAGVVLVSFMGSGGGKDKSAASTTTTTIQAGTVVVNSAPAAPTSFTIPEGKQAVAIQLPYVAGLAGYAKAGDTVNVYATIDEKGVGIEPPPPLSKLALPGVQVLAVTAPAPGVDAGNATYLLALDAAQAEQVIFFAKYQSMWLTLVPKGQPKAPATPGRTYKNVF